MTPKNIHKIFIPEKKILIFLKTQINIEIQNYSLQIDIIPLFTKYRCILITGVLRFLQMTVACDIIIRNFPLNIVYNTSFSLHQKKKKQKCRF